MPLASSDMAFVELLKYRCAKFEMERPGSIYMYSGLKWKKNSVNIVIHNVRTWVQMRDESLIFALIELIELT